MGGPVADNQPMSPAPEGKFRVACIDFPWHFQGFGKTDEEKTRNPQRHYPTMDVDHICSLPIMDVMEKDALVWMWITGPMLVAGAHSKIFRAYDLKPSAMGFVWIKTKKNFDIETLHRTPLLEADLFCSTAFTTLQNAEFCLLARRGNGMPRLQRNIRQVIVEPVREHSRKPELSYKRIEAYSHGPRIDIFGGRPRDGWTYWGMPHWENGRV